MRRAQCGFSLLELLVALGILGVVVSIAMSGTNQLIKTNASVSNNVDLIQEGRQFMDQISSDLHQSGYPSYRMFDTTKVAATSYAGNPTNSNSSGLVSASTTALQFEGDVDNSGVVSEVYLNLKIPAGGCPCTMQRGTVQKTLNPGNPPYYTELTGVMNQDIFTYWTNDGQQVNDMTQLSNIRSVRVKLQVQSSRKDGPSGAYAVATLDTQTKINN